MRRTLILTIVVLAGCGGQAASTTTTTTSTTTTTTTAPTTTTSTTVPPTTTTEPGYDWVYAEPADAPVPVLVDPGSMPHEVHEYRLTVGSMTTASMRFEIFISQATAEQTVETRTEIEIDIVAEVLEVTDEGFVVNTTFGAANVEASDPGIRINLESAYRALEGQSFLQLIDPNGAVVATAGVEDIPGADFIGSSNAFSNATSPLPTEPFGIGAVWETTTTLAEGGMVLLQTARFEVVDIDGPLLTLLVVTTQDLGPDGFRIPGVDPEDLEVVFDTEATGDAVWDLESPLPVSARSETSQELTATLTLPTGTEQFMQMLELTIEITR